MSHYQRDPNIAKPGDTDADYFADYTDEQREWVTQWGDAINVEAEARYGEGT